MFDLDDVFYRPLWIRWLLVSLALGWGLFEFGSFAPFFGVIFVAIAVYTAWRFFVTFDPADQPGEER